MATLVSADWVSERIAKDGFTIVDPRRPMRYLAGHLRGAINVPMYKLFDANGRLMQTAALAEYLGASGLSSASIPVLYDSPEGQNAAMLAWTLEYLGRADVPIMREFFETWKNSGREVLYRPVTAQPAKFEPRVNPAPRISTEEAKRARDVRFIDFRSVEEFSGARVMGEDQAGHIPGAINIVWRELADGSEAILKDSAELATLLQSRGIERGARVVAYCRSGPRAALGYLALKEAGYAARLYDGSWAEWSRAGLPAQK